MFWRALLRGFDTLERDLRYAMRSLRLSPGFATVAIAALALGIGGTTAIYSLFDAMHAHRLPYAESNRLVEIIGTVQRERAERRGASFPDFVDWRAQSHGFVDLAAFDPQLQTLQAGNDVERINTEFVSASYFGLLGIVPAEGRTFRADEDDVAKPAFVTVLGDGLWRRRFGADPTIVGRTIRFNGDSYTVIGIAPPGFQGLSDQAEAWIPFALFAPPSAMNSRANRGFNVLGKLRPGVTVAAARQEIDTISRRLATAYPVSNEGRSAEVVPLDLEIFADMRPAVIMLLVAVAFVLLIACGNVANLMIARLERRRGDIAVRLALGARRMRLVRQLVAESCLLTLVGAGLGLIVARAIVDALIANSPVAFPSFVAPTLDVRIAAFTIAVSLACGILIGLFPALQTPRDLRGTLGDFARGTFGARTRRLRDGLIVAEVALAVVLLVGAGLMIQSVRNVAAIDPGFDARSVLTVHASVPRAAAPAVAPLASTPPGPVVAARVLVERLRALPGVRAAALGADVPLDGRAAATFYAAEGHTTTDARTRPRTYVHLITPEFFQTLRIPIVTGRTFDQREMSPDANVVVVSERLVERFWPGEDPIGKRIRLGTAPWLSIVGVVREVKYRGLPENPTADPDIYLPFLDRNQQVAIAIRTDVPPETMAAAVRAEIQKIDRAIPVYAVATLESLVAERTGPQRFTMWLMGVFAAVALILSVLGLYGVMSYLVAQRTREIGIRLALGATAARVHALIVGNGARLVAAGVAIGTIVSLGLDRIVATLVFRAATMSASTLVPIAILVAVSLAACYVPAFRATRLDPMRALRED